MHDPTTGEWHDIPTKDAPAWAKTEAFKRKDLYKAGTKKRVLLQSELEEVWEKEQKTSDLMDEEAAAVTERGIVFEDYLERDE